MSRKIYLIPTTRIVSNNYPLILKDCRIPPITTNPKKVYSNLRIKIKIIIKINFKIKNSRIKNFRINKMYL